jgi:hypothetical protein
MSKWREKYKVHPAADVFPMMSDEELQKLGEDIKANGLISSITLQCCEDDVLLDGRNRMEAMERCGIALPEFFEIAEGDPVAYVMSKNIHRRHLTKQQQSRPDRRGS